MSHLRVISGTAKGRKLRMVPGEGTRPVTDRVKQALFNIIGPDVEGSAFLDLYAGTGSVGIEALSRGAKRVVFVDGGRWPQNHPSEPAAHRTAGRQRAAPDVTALKKQGWGLRLPARGAASVPGLWGRTVGSDRQVDGFNPDCCDRPDASKEFANLPLQR
jgi:hypothetical protein